MHSSVPSIVQLSTVRHVETPSRTENARNMNDAENGIHENLVECRAIVTGAAARGRSFDYRPVKFAFESVLDMARR